MDGVRAHADLAGDHAERSTASDGSDHGPTAGGLGRVPASSIWAAHPPQGVWVGHGRWKGGQPSVYALRFLTGCWKPWLGWFWGFDLHAEAGRLQLERPALKAWLQVALEDNDDLVRAVFAYGFEHAAVVFAVDSGNYDGAGAEVEFEDWLTGRAVGWYEIRGELVWLQGQRDFEATYLDLGFLAHGPFSITTRDRVLNSTRCKLVYLHRPGRGTRGGRATLRQGDAAGGRDFD